MDPHDRTNTPSESSEHPTVLPPLSALYPPVFFDLSKPSSPSQPYTDQTCLSWCAQSSSRRQDSLDPVCRMACFRTDRANRAGEIDLKGIRAWRRSVRHWIEDRELTFFRGTLSEMRDLQAGVKTAEEKNGKVLSKEGKLVKRRKANGIEREFEIERSDVGETGRIVHVPLGSLVIQPPIDWINRVSPIFRPSYSLVTAYIASFFDGTQTQMASIVTERALSGEVFGFTEKLGKRVWEHWAGKFEQIEEERRKANRSSGSAESNGGS